MKKKRYLKILIKNNNGNFETKEYIIQILTYLDGATPNNEEVVGSNANYRVYSIKPQNVALLVYFEKII